MSQVSAQAIKDLRARTGAGMLDCRNALTEANGDMEAAIEVLRKKGLKSLGKRADKVAAEGTMGVYIHPGDQVVALVELNCETDFVARGEEFRAVARDIAMHVAAMRPDYLCVEDVPEEILERERNIVREQLNDSQKGKADQIVEGKLKKFFAETVLLEQPFVKDDSGKKAVRSILEELGVKCGEKVSLRRFHRLEVGEGIEKVQANLAEEVAQYAAAQ